MSRNAAISDAISRMDDGSFRERLARLVAMPTESQNPDRAEALETYLITEMIPEFHALGFKTQILSHELAKGPFLFAERLEGAELPTVFGYGHGDVIRGLDTEWAAGLSPWRLVEKDERWYGRGVADNKGQHALNLAALASVLKTRGNLGFNAKYLIEMGEEVGSPGLREICQEHRASFSADLLLASDGPRLTAERPLVFLGSRGAVLVDLEINARAGGHHSGNWGGLLSNPAIRLSHAIAAIVAESGQIRVPALVPSEIPASVRQALADCIVDGGPDGPIIETWWGEPGLSTAEKVFGWCNFEVLAFEAGNPRTPVNAIPPKAWARCQLRFVVGIDIDRIVPAIKDHLARHGLSDVKVSLGRDASFQATRLDPSHPHVGWAAASIKQSTGKNPNILPNSGGALPNDIFSEILGLPTLWVPHSYPGCSQHAPNEHVPKAVLREGLALMAGLYWDMPELPRRQAATAAQLVTGTLPSIG